MSNQTICATPSSIHIGNLIIPIGSYERMKISSTQPTVTIWSDGAMGARDVVVINFTFGERTQALQLARNIRTIAPNIVSAVGTRASPHYRIHSADETCYTNAETPLDLKDPQETANSWEITTFVWEMMSQRYPSIKELCAPFLTYYGTLRQMTPLANHVLNTLYTRVPQQTLTPEQRESLVTIGAIAIYRSARPRVLPS